MDPARWAEDIPLGDPGQITPAAERFFRRIARPIVRLAHRPTLSGTEHLPTQGPYLLVANHSGGLAIAEIATFIVLYLDAIGPSRPIAGFAHPFVFHTWPLSRILPQLGAIPSSYAAAEGAFARGVPILVFPGGDHEAFRPFWQHHRVDFDGRAGFLRMARKAWVPVVPMGIRGSHLTAPVLFRSRALATLAVWPRLIGGKRWALTLLGALGAAGIYATAPFSRPVRAALAWAFAASPLEMIPWVPTTIRMQIGQPISPEELFGTRDSGDEVLAAAVTRVQSEVQRLVTG